MVTTVEIHEKILKKLSSIKDTCSGFLYGISTKSNVLILGLELTDSAFINSLPVGLDICGYFCNGEKIEKFKLENNEINRPSVVIYYTQSSSQLNVQVLSEGELLKVDYQILNNEQIYSQYIFTRCKGSIPIKCEYTSQAIGQHIGELKKQLFDNADDARILFQFHKQQKFINSKHVIGTENDTSKIYDIYRELHSSGDDSNKKKKSPITKPKILDFDILWQLTSDNKVKSKSQHAPVCILNKNSMIGLDTVANTDVLAMVPVDMKLSLLYPILVKSVIQYLQLYEDALKKLNKENCEIKFETFHFLPDDLVHFMTLLYLKNEPDEALKSFRQTLHKQLLMDQNSPRFRRSNQYLFESAMYSNAPLVNPHEGVKFTDNGGDIALVRGKYLYYHYCQNNMDDNGWGCAYRSLQTLASWFKLQGYVDKDAPTFSEIQKCLVDIKDKPSSFLGSRQWIGSTEVSFVLNTLLGIDCKILFVSSGEEMETKGPELVNHFRTQGSPIMIGGGVLAHTILGVDYNQSTGKLKFLILDPHYTGGEDIHVIQSKGWCGWKTADFWDKRAYYNMCLPQVPRDV